MSIQSVIFDLDGTLADTAPDLAGALNQLLLDQGLPVLPLERLRPFVSQGVRGLLHRGMGMTPSDARYASFSEKVLAYYSESICVKTRLFSGVLELLQTLETRLIPWAIVTNKHSRFTDPLVEALGLGLRAACVVSGDTAARPKPAPDPLLYACERMSVLPERCIYVGDDVRDVVAGRACSMKTLAAAWGYLGEGEPIERWGADRVIQSPLDVLDCLGE